MKINLLLLSICCFAITNSGYAQKVGRYHKNLQYEAELYFQQGDYYYASELFEELLVGNPESPEINGQLGISYYHLPPFKEKAHVALSKAVELGDTEALFFLAKLRHEEYRFFNALEMLSLYEHRPERKQPASEIEQAKAAASRAADLVKTPIQVSITNLGMGVNSAVHDYAPVWDMAGNQMYFTSRRRFDDRSEKDFTEQFDENIYVVDLNAEVHIAQPAYGTLNSRSNDASIACSSDGKEMIVYRTSKDGLAGNLFITTHGADGWGKLEKLSDKINSKHHEASASFGGPNQAVLYFSSDRPGGYGGKDIYKVQKMPDNSWSEPYNLGHRINTPLDDDAPFVALDGTLYFASKGHDNMGGFDIFSALPVGDGFADPTNMGYPINTPADDIFFSIDSTGKFGYFSSDRKGGYGLQDIYSINFSDAETVIYRGQLVSQNSTIEAGATVRLIDNQRGSETALYQIEPGQKEFVLALDYGKSYTLIVEATGYPKVEQAVGYKETAGKIVINDEIMLSK